MVINERCISVLLALNETNGFTLKKLSEKFNVHTRTIRYDIDNVNFILKSYGLGEIKKNDDGILKTNLKSNDLNKIIFEFRGMFSENRKTYLKLKLLSKKNVNLIEEAELLNISRVTLKKDISIIKTEFQEKKVFIDESSLKEIFIDGSRESILELFEDEINKVIEKQFVNLPNILKELVGKIVGDINPTILKSRVKEVLGNNYSLIEYNKIFCKLAVLNTRYKLERKKKSNLEDINTFIMCSRGREFILNQKGKVNKNNSLEDVRGILKDVINILEIESDNELLEKLLKELAAFRKNLSIPEKICETNFYKEFLEKMKSDIVVEKDIQSIFYLLYNQFSLKKYSDLEEFKVLFVCDELEVVKDLIEKKLKHIFDFKKIDRISSYIFEIFGCNDDYDLIITSENINELLETPVYKINKFPLESTFIDLKFFLLKKLKKIDCL